MLKKTLRIYGIFVTIQSINYTCLYTCLKPQPLSSLGDTAMPQISLYIDEETLKKVKKAADADNTSISKWVGKQLKKTLQSSYTEDFQNLFGSIRDESLTIPERSSFDMDVKRESLE
jgi:hypothetical protein